MSVANLLEGRRSGEGERSFRGAGLAQRERARKGRASAVRTLSLLHPQRIHRIDAPGAPGRRALASSATPPRIATTAPNVTGSVELTP